MFQIIFQLFRYNISIFWTNIENWKLVTTLFMGCPNTSHRIFYHQQHDLSIKHISIFMLRIMYYIIYQFSSKEMLPVACIQILHPKSTKSTVVYWHFALFRRKSYIEVTSDRSFPSYYRTFRLLCIDNSIYIRVESHSGSRVCFVARIYAHWHGWWMFRFSWRPVWL